MYICIYTHTFYIANYVNILSVTYEHMHTRARARMHLHTHLHTRVLYWYSCKS